MSPEFDEKFVIEVNEERCSTCTICSASCPFEVIKLDSASGKVILEAENCKICGICYSACPAGAISTLYYDLDSLVKYMEWACVEYDSNTLVLMCMGSAPAFKEIRKMFGISKFIPLPLPCIGRTPIELFLKCLTMGINKIYVIACKEDYCRFEKGSMVMERKIPLLQHLLDQLGYGRETITLRRNTLTAEVNTFRCGGCLLCIEVCPFDAIDSQVMREGRAVAVVDESLCKGCGLCVAACRFGALELQGSTQRQLLAEVMAL